MTTAVAITGNTYPVKDQIKALGGKWNNDSKCWMVPADKADEARKLVAGSGGNVGKPSAFRRTTCTVCGHKATNRYGDVIYRSGECRDCYEERKMGY